MTSTSVMATGNSGREMWGIGENAGAEGLVKANTFLRPADSGSHDRWEHPSPLRRSGRDRREDADPRGRRAFWGTAARRQEERPGRRPASSTINRAAGATDKSLRHSQSSSDNARLRSSVNRRVANVTTVGQEAVQSVGELSSRKSSQPIDGSSYWTRAERILPNVPKPSLYGGCAHPPTAPILGELS